MLRVNNILIETMITDFSKGYEKLFAIKSSFEAISE